MVRRVISIGEAMIEMSGGADARYRLGFAGDTLNAAYYLRARLGEGWAIDYFTALGDDLYSGLMLSFMERCGIGVNHIRQETGGRPGLYLIHQADGDRQFTYWRETSAARSLADDPKALANALTDVDLIYFSGITIAILTPAARSTLLAAIGRGRGQGARVAFDPNIRPSLWPDPSGAARALEAAASVADIVLPTHADEVPFFGDADEEATARRYLDAGAQEVVVKNGADPALVATADGRWRVEAQKVASVLDATGAGDSFNGGYLAARLSGTSPRDAAVFGHATAAMVIGFHGALAPLEAFDVPDYHRTVSVPQIG